MFIRLSFSKGVFSGSGVSFWGCACIYIILSQQQTFSLSKDLSCHSETFGGLWDCQQILEVLV